MSQSTSRLIRDYCRATGAPRKILKRIMVRTPVERRAVVLGEMRRTVEEGKGEKIQHANP